MLMVTCGINGRSGVLQKAIAMLSLLFGLAHAVDGSSGHSRHMLKFVKPDNVTVSSNAATLETTETKQSDIGEKTEAVASSGDVAVSATSSAVEVSSRTSVYGGSDGVYAGFEVKYKWEYANKAKFVAKAGQTTTYFPNFKSRAFVGTFTDRPQRSRMSEKELCDPDEVDGLGAGKIVGITSPGYHPRTQKDDTIVEKVKSKVTGKHHTMYSIPGVVMKPKRWSDITQMKKCMELMKMYVEVYSGKHSLYLKEVLAEVQGAKTETERSLAIMAAKHKYLKPSYLSQDGERLKLGGMLQLETDEDRLARLNFVLWLGLNYKNRITHEDTSDFAEFNTWMFDQPFCHPRGKLAKDDMDALFAAAVEEMQA